ncbi:MAG: hypothetical protein ACOYNB_11035 [Aquabacterium sp.]|uniref:hypothetical protein n=1 Tax=Aquabacterium sp. TaxID=1872578 RepID=UPI003BBB3FB3
MACGLAVAQAAPLAQGAPVLQCAVRYASEVWHMQARPTLEPYEVPLSGLAERFAFKAVVAGSAAHIDHVTVTVYDLEVAGAPVILQTVRHLPPFALGAEIPSLTGWNHVYSARKGRELVYGCALQTEGQS